MSNTFTRCQYNDYFDTMQGYVYIDSRSIAKYLPFKKPFSLAPIHLTQQQESCQLILITLFHLIPQLKHSELH